MDQNDTDKNDTDKVVQLNDQETEQVVGGASRPASPGHHGGSIIGNLPTLGGRAFPA